MRSDMQKVIVERPRHGSRQPNRGTARRVRPVEVDDDFDSGPSRASSARTGKWFNEHLSPLWRYLRSSLGRPWDKVYAEICGTLDSRGVLGNHVLDHLRSEVNVNCYQEGKRILSRGRFGSPDPVSGFFVHPKTGLLLEAPRPRWRRKQPREAIGRVIGPAGEIYGLFDGLWFAVEYRLEDGQYVLTSKRQCNSKTVRQIVSWIEAAERGKRGYERGADSVRVPRAFDTPRLAS
jgi:hypothetical protein